MSSEANLRETLGRLLEAATSTGRTNKPRATLNAAWVARLCEAALRPAPHDHSETGETPAEGDGLAR